MPEAAVAPSPAPTPTPDVTPTAPPPKAGMPMSDAWADLDKYTSLPKAEPSAIPKGPSSKTKSREPAPPPEPAKLAEPSKTPDDKPKAEETPGKPAESPKGADTGKPKKPADFLREKLASVERERNEFKAEVERLKSAKPAEDPEKKSLSERLESEAKRRQELEDEIKFHAYEKSSEFKEKYHQPYVDAYRQAQKKTASLKVVQREDEDDRVIQQSRAATPEDFDRIAALPDAEAAELARQLFGESASNLVLWHREKVLDLAQSQLNALEEYRKHGAEREKQAGEIRTKQQKEMTDLFHKLNTDAAEKYPQWFKEIEGDEEGNALLKKGYERADLAFSNPNLPTQKLVELHSEIRNKAAAFPRLIYQAKALQARIAELESELAQYKGSEPKGAEGVSTPPGKHEPTKQGDDIDSVVSGLDRYAKEAY